MSTHRRDVYPAVKQGRYPHMLAEDVALWNKFLDEWPEQFEGVEYDVHVGGEVERLRWWSDQVQRMGEWLAAKRIDVVGYRPGEIWIVEVKPYAGVAAIGQVLCYLELYRKDRRPPEKLVGCIVTDKVTPDLRYLVGVFAIQVFEVGRPG